MGGKKKSKISSRQEFSHPEGLQETEFYLGLPDVDRRERVHDTHPLLVINYQLGGQA